MAAFFPAEAVNDLVKKHLPQVIEIRRRIHSEPELGFREVKTTALVKKHLAELGLEVMDLGDTTGAAAILRGGKPGPVTGLRADLDALPIQEQTGLPFQSKNAGVMHACGHDGHTAMLLGAAMVLRELADEVPGTVKFVFQPAEELLQGAKALIDRGVLADPKPVFFYAFHVWPSLPLGHFGIKPGPAMAGAARFQATFSGQGGHGANPHLTVDPILAAANWVTLLQSIVGRKVDPVDPAVVSVGTIQGGTSYNSIASSVSLEGTVRAVTPGTAGRIARWLEETLQGAAAAAGTACDFNYQELCPPVLNDPKEAAQILDLVGRLFGPERAHALNQPSMIAEDFAYFLQEAKGCLVFLGTGEAEQATALHTDTFNFNEEALSQGIRLMVHLVLAKG